MDPQFRARRTVTQRDEPESPPAEDFTSAEEYFETLKDVVSRYEALEQKADNLQGLIETAIKDLYIEVEDAEISELLTRIYGDLKDIDQGRKIPFLVFKDLLSIAAGGDDITSREMVFEHAKRTPSKSGKKRAFLAAKGVSEEVAAFINNAFFSVQLLGYANSITQDLRYNSIILAGGPTNPEGVEIGFSAKLAESLTILGAMGANLSYVQQFLQNIGGLLNLGPNGGVPVVEKPDGQLSFMLHAVEAFKTDAQRTWAMSVVEWANTEVSKKIGDEPRFEAWVAYTQVEIARLDIQSSKNSLKPLTRKADLETPITGGTVTANTTFRSATPVDLEAFGKNVTNVISGAYEDATTIAGNTADTIEAGYLLSKSVLNVFSEESDGINGILDSAASFLNTSYGPDMVCCLARITGSTIDPDTIRLLAKTLYMLNAVSNWNTGTDLNRRVQDLAGKIDRFIEKKILLALDSFINKTIKPLDDVINGYTDSEFLSELAKCGPIADLLLLLRRTIEEIKDMVIELLRKLSMRLRLNKFAFDVSSSTSFENALAGKLAALLNRIADLMTSCPDPRSSSGAGHFIGNTADVSAAKPTVAIPDSMIGNNIYRDFNLKTFKTQAAGLTFTPGQQTLLTNVALSGDEDILRSCVGAPGSDTLNKFVQQTAYIRDRLRRTRNGTL